MTVASVAARNPRLRARDLHFEISESCSLDCCSDAANDAESLSNPSETDGPASRTALPLPDVHCPGPGPGAGAGSVSVSLYQGKYYGFHDAGMEGPFDTLDEAESVLGILDVNEATVTIWDQERGLIYPRDDDEPTAEEE